MSNPFDFSDPGPQAPAAPAPATANPVALLELDLKTLVVTPRFLFPVGYGAVESERLAEQFGATLHLFAKGAFNGFIERGLGHLVRAGGPQAEMARDCLDSFRKLNDATSDRSERPAIRPTQVFRNLTRGDDDE